MSDTRGADSDGETVYLVSKTFDREPTREREVFRMLEDAEEHAICEARKVADDESDVYQTTDAYPIFQTSAEGGLYSWSVFALRLDRVLDDE